MLSNWESLKKSESERKKELNHGFFLFLNHFTWLEFEFENFQRKTSQNPFVSLEWVFMLPFLIPTFFIQKVWTHLIQHSTLKLSTLSTHLHDLLNLHTLNLIAMTRTLRMTMTAILNLSLVNRPIKSKSRKLFPLLPFLDPTSNIKSPTKFQGQKSQPLTSKSS